MKIICNCGMKVYDTQAIHSSIGDAPTNRIKGEQHAVKSQGGVITGAIQLFIDVSTMKPGEVGLNLRCGCGATVLRIAHGGT